jgi:hypothetical protein
LAARLAVVVALSLLAFVSACGPDRGFRPTLGQPSSAGVIIYHAPPGGRFDYFVYMPNSTTRLEDRAARLAEARRRVADRCRVAEATDLYGHEVGVWPDGRARLYYAVGVRCAPEPGPAPAGAGP